jgi:2-dehydro-3-deoxygluconokinase
MSGGPKVGGRLVCFGEVLARLSTQDYLPLSDASALNLHFAGAEANVAVQFASLGGESSLVSRVPENRLADTLLEKIRGRGVEASGVLRGGARLGLYFLEPGYGARASVITYDRANSSMASVQRGMFDWQQAFRGASWFHWSGITPALGPETAAVCADALAAARGMGVKVSCDLNYRSALWSPQEAGRVMRPLVRELDLCICGAAEGRSILGAPDFSQDSSAQESTARWLKEEYGIRALATPIRSGETAQGGSFQGMYFDGVDTHLSRTHELSVIDRIGSGDSFAGALLYALNEEMAPQKTVEFATAAAVWKHTIPGDWFRGSRRDVESLAEGFGGAVVKR